MEKLGRVSQQPQVTTETVGIVYVLPVTRARADTISALSSAMQGHEHVAHRSKATVVSGGALSRRRACKYYVWFHIDSLDEGTRAGGGAKKKRTQRKYYLLHVVFDLRPATPPPTPLADGAKAGHTLEWLVRELDGLGRPERYLVETELRVVGGAAPPPFVGLPLGFRGQALDVRGVEYAAKEPDDGSLRRFGWRRENDGLSVQLAYTTDRPFSLKDTWEHQQEEARKFLSELL